MKIITSINAKGGCGKSTVASNFAAGLARRGKRTLLLDLDPQAQITEWYHLGDQFSVRGSITAVFTGQQALAEVIQATHLPNLSFVASSAPLEELGQQLRGHDGYEQFLSHFLVAHDLPPFDFVVIDSPNQVSPVMDNAIFATDLFVIPFLDTSSVRSFPNVYKQIHEVRDDEDYRVLHVLTNLSRMPGKRRVVLDMLEEFDITPSRTELRHCAYLGQSDTHGGSIFEYMPKSNGAADMDALIDEALDTLAGREVRNSVPAEHADEPAEQPVPEGVTSEAISSSDEASEALEALRKAS